MAGIYLHVPFCKVKCHYCDFHFSVQLKNRAELIDALVLEIRQRKDFLGDQIINTIYFGGGTPSVVEVELLAKLIDIIHKSFNVNPNCEITVECNPDDLTADKLKAYRSLGVNRLSLGIQSFDDKVLRFMNRAHSAEQAKNAVLMAQAVGFDNLTIDLIYGVPGSTRASWADELNQMKALEIPHLSAYCLTIEENTVFGNWLKNGKLKAFSDEESLAQFQYLMDFTSDLGMEHYEISNFAKPGYISQHNSAYWLGEHYLGIGPSAHSYNGVERGWNVANNMKYLQAVKKGDAYYENEMLSTKDRFNDYILTRLRTKWGIQLSDMNLISEEMTQSAAEMINGYLQNGSLIQVKDGFFITQKGRFIVDGISADLFYDDETTDNFKPESN